MIDKIKSLFSIEYFPLFLIVVLCTRYVPIDTRAGVSPFKIGIMIISCFYLIKYFKVSNAVVIGTIFLLYIFLTSSIINSHTFRLSTVLYLSLFVVCYMAFYNLVYFYSDISLLRFIKFIKYSIIVSAIVLIVQQVFILAGIKYFPLINLAQILNRGIGANSLYGEPSVFARVMLVLYYSYLKCNEYLTDSKLSIKDIFNANHKWVTYLFLWSMLSMGSGTAFICLAILSLYFMRGWQIIVSIPIFIGVYFVLDHFEMEQFERARAVVVATSSGDAQEVIEADGSASARIAPVLNTLSIDLSDYKSWVGEGCDSSLGYRHTNNRYLGSINDYGLISYIFCLLLTFTCVMHFRSLSTIMFFCGVGGAMGNIPYGWGLLMILTVVRYMHDIGQYNKEPAKTDETDEDD